MLDSVGQSQNADDMLPENSIVADGDITEGGVASFTITADQAPSASADVMVAVTQSGDFGVTVGSRTVVLGPSRTATLTVSTTDDSVDEPDGSVTVTLSDGTDYTVSATQGAATVAVSDTLLSTVRYYYEANKDNPPNYGENWKRVLIAFGDVADANLTRTRPPRLERRKPSGLAGYPLGWRLSVWKEANNYNHLRVGHGRF